MLECIHPEHMQYEKQSYAQKCIWLLASCPHACGLKCLCLRSTISISPDDQLGWKQLVQASRKRDKERHWQTTFCKCLSIPGTVSCSLIADVCLTAKGLGDLDMSLLSPLARKLSPPTHPPIIALIRGLISVNHCAFRSPLQPAARITETGLSMMAWCHRGCGKIEMGKNRETFWNEEREIYRRGITEPSVCMPMLEHWSVNGTCLSKWQGGVGGVFGIWIERCLFNSSKLSSQ